MLFRDILAIKKEDNKFHDLKRTSSPWDVPDRLVKGFANPIDKLRTRLEALTKLGNGGNARLLGENERLMKENVRLLEETNALKAAAPPPPAPLNERKFLQRTELKKNTKWSTGFSEQYKPRFYMNNDCGETVWEKPADYGGEEEQRDSTKILRRLSSRSGSWGVEK